MSWWLGGRGTKTAVRAKLANEDPAADANQPVKAKVRALVLDTLDNMDPTVNGVYVNAGGHEGGASAYLQIEVRQETLVLDDESK
jgi:hypothetical protein